MATRNGAEGPSNLKSSENLIACWAVAGPARRVVPTAAARISPACLRLMDLNGFMSLSLTVSGPGFDVAPRPSGCELIAAQQRTCRMKEQDRSMPHALVVAVLHIRSPACRCGGQY